MRRAVEAGVPRKIEVEDYTNLTISLALYAGAIGVPFTPTKSLLGTGMMEGNHPFKEMECPYTNEKVALVPALKPDVAIVQAQRADEEGNTHFWGGSGVTKEAALAARKVIVVVEELVDKKVIRRDPNRTLVPGFLVSAVVEYISYHNKSRDRDGYVKWLDRWVLGVQDRKEYLTLVGEERKESLLVKHGRKSIPVNYGF
jgi:glutaconate CoA-transferase subunit A